MELGGQRYAQVQYRYLDIRIISFENRPTAAFCSISPVIPHRCDALVCHVCRKALNTNDGIKLNMKIIILEMTHI
jgi:hypothetical protein